MKEFLAAFIVFLLMLGTGTFYGYRLYQDLTTAKSRLETGWNLVQENYQQRVLIVPQILKESEFFTEVNEVTRDHITKALRAVEQLGADNKTTKLMKYKEFQEFQKIQNDLSKTLQQLWTEVDNHPPVKMAHNLTTVRGNLETLNKKILETKIAFNTLAETYNTKVIKFPSAIVALMYGFERRSPFDPKNMNLELP